MFSFARNTPLQKMNLEFAQQNTPFRDHPGMLGRIDFVEPRSQGLSVFRGWVFHLQYPILQLHLHTANFSKNILTLGLQREDVHSTFGNISRYSAHSGFVGVVETSEIEDFFETSQLRFSVQLLHTTVDNVVLRKF